MSLRYDLTKIPVETITFFPTEEDKKNDSGFLKPKTNALIWITMFVDLNEITKKNVDEFWWRLQFLLSIDCGYFQWKEEQEKKHGIPCSPWEITKQDLIDHIGLSTNASKKTRNQFCKRYLETLKDRVDVSSSYPHTIKEGSDEAKKFDALYSKANKEWEEAKCEEAKEEEAA
jgi:hypothetical protein